MPSTRMPPTPTFRNGIRTGTLEVGTELIRVHHCDVGPIWFGPKPGSPPGSRFDAPGGEYKTMYAAATLEGAFAETILHGKALDQFVGKAYAEQRAWTSLTALRPLKLMKLYDEGLFWHGTDACVSVLDSYGASRGLALAAFQEAPDLDGITYRSRHDNGELCHALFDRVLGGDLRVGISRSFQNHADVLDASPPLLPP